MVATVMSAEVARAFQIQLTADALSRLTPWQLRCVRHAVADAIAGLACDPRTDVDPQAVSELSLVSRSGDTIPLGAGRALRVVDVRGEDAEHRPSWSSKRSGPN